MSLWLVRFSMISCICRSSFVQRCWRWTSLFWWPPCWCTGIWNTKSMQGRWTAWPALWDGGFFWTSAGESRQTRSRGQGAGSCFWMWTALNRWMIPLDIRPGTKCFAGLPRCWKMQLLTVALSAGAAEMNLRWWSAGNWNGRSWRKCWAGFYGILPKFHRIFQWAAASERTIFCFHMT